MDIKRSGSQPSGKGPEDYFTGGVRVDPLFQAPDPARVVGASVKIRAGRPYRLAYAPAGSDLDRHVWPRMGAARGRAG